MIEPRDTTALILAGGLGTRLRDAVSDRSKVAAEVGGRPFITRIFDQLVTLGISRAVLCTGYKAEGVEEILGQSYGPLELVYSPESEPLGTAGAIRNAVELVDSDTALVLNGDSCFTANPLYLFDLHNRTGAKASIMLCFMQDVATYGRVRVKDSAEIEAFDEKRGISEPGWVNAGLYLLRKDRIESIPSGKPVSLEKDVFPGWIGQGLFGCEAEGTLLDIGTPERYAKAEEFFAALDG